MWGADHCRTGYWFELELAEEKTSVDGFEDGPETGAYDAESEFGVGPDACGCVIPFVLTVIVSLSYSKGGRSRVTQRVRVGGSFPLMLT